MQGLLNKGRGMGAWDLFVGNKMVSSASETVSKVNSAFQGQYGAPGIRGSPGDKGKPVSLWHQLSSLYVLLLEMF